MQFAKAKSQSTKSGVSVVQFHIKYSTPPPPHWHTFRSMVRQVAKVRWRHHTRYRRIDRQVINPYLNVMQTMMEKRVIDGQSGVCFLLLNILIYAASVFKCTTTWSFWRRCKEDTDGFYSNLQSMSHNNTCCGTMWITFTFITMENLFLKNFTVGVYKGFKGTLGAIYFKE